VRFRWSDDIHHDDKEPAEEEDPSECIETKCDSDNSAEIIASGITFPIQISRKSINESSQSNSQSTKLNERCEE